MRRMFGLLCALLVGAQLVGCGEQAGGGTQSPGEAPSNAVQISIAYSPEKESWLKERIATFNSSGAKLDGKPIFVEGLNKSSGAARTELKNDQLDVTVWSPSSSTWLEVLKQESGNANIAVSSRPLVLTPVVISMWKPMAEALGWPNKALGWGDMLKLINDPQGWGAYGHPEWGKFTWGHTDPEISTTALSTLLAEYYAAVGKQRDLTVADVQKAESQQFIRDLGKGIKHYGYNTLVFSDNMQKFGTSYISAFPMEEITLIDFNKNKAPAVPLVAIYPKEGTFWHDDPFIVMSKASAEQQQAAETFFTFLMNDESQKAALSYGFRPASANVPLADPVSERYGVQPQGVQNVLPVPSAEVIVAAKNVWQQNRKRADIVLLVDTSGSMEGDKIEQVKAGLETFLARILPEDRIALVTFDSTATVAVPPAPLSENRIALSEAIQQMNATGKTAIYNGLDAAKQVLDGLPKTGEDRIQAIVLLSDGADTASSLTFDQIKSSYEETGINIFPVAYGADADKQVLQQIVDFSHTILVEGDTGNIGQIFDNLSRYF